MLYEKIYDMKKILLLVVLSIVFSGLSGQEKFTDKRDGNVYRTVTFDGITWMTENLRFKSLEGVYFDNDSNNSKGYGVLYEWKAAIKACPDGWHLPTGAEYHTLFNHFEHKESWGTKGSDPDVFNIQLGGMQDYEGVFSEMDESGYYWTSTEYGTHNAEYFSYLLIEEKHIIDISRKEDSEDIRGTEKSNRYSVRCIKN
jgi:uncharacterized protein (TIGR02145 family)